MDGEFYHDLPDWPLSALMNESLRLSLQETNLKWEQATDIVELVSLTMRQKAILELQCEILREMERRWIEAEKRSRDGF